jgi:hypothetical protein
MPPPRSALDPEGYYARLGLQPGAPRADVLAAYRAKARLLHPDVPETGNTAAFVAVKQAYDVLSNQDRRQAYDRAARVAAIQPEVIVVQRAVYQAPARSRHPRFSDLPMMVWAGVAAFLVLSVYQMTIHLLAPSGTIRADIRPNAATVLPLSPSAHLEVMYGPTPRQLPGTPNFYVVPAGSPAVLWRIDPVRDALVPMGQLPLFSTVQAIRLIRKNGMLEVLVNAQVNGFISADHLTAGNAVAAHHAYCGYNAGPAPFDGEVLQQRGDGDGVLELRNRALQPAVVKLRDDQGAVVLSVFLAPGGHATLDGLPKGVYHPDFAIGELWSRACNVFAVGMQARRIKPPLRVPGDSLVVTAPDSQMPATVDISEQMFGQD